MESLTFHIAQARRGLLRRKQWYFRIVAPNGKTLCHSESYNNLQDARSAIRLITTLVSTSQIKENA